MASLMDEKLPLANRWVPAPWSRPGRQPTPLHRWIIVAVFIIAYVGINTYNNTPWRQIFNQSESPAKPILEKTDPFEFKWDELKPSSNLDYAPCYGIHYCARLEVPLDWNSTDPNSKQATLAIIKRPAPVDVTHPSYGGAILFNPGGPGGSGVEFVNLYGDALATVLNTNPISGGEEAFANNSRFYDLISWDPRGVGETRPVVTGYTAGATRAEFDQKWRELAGSLEYPEIFNRVYDIKGLDAALISEPQDGYTEDEHPAKFAGTTSVCRDMIEIIEKHGQWREKAAKKILDHRRKASHVEILQETEDIQQRMKYIPGEEKLQYWGFSYGTIIGQTFATMYPDRVGRLIIDGVVNATDYYAGLWSTELIDAERINENFTQECEAAGPTGCSFAKLTRKSSETLLDGFEKTFSSVRSLPITGVVTKQPIYMTEFWLSTLLFSGYYSGFFGYRFAAEMLWNAAIRNKSFFAPPKPQVKSSQVSLSPWTDREAAQVMIVCIDSESKVNETREEYLEILHKVQKQSPHFGNGLSRITMPCHSFTVEPKWRFAGPFGANTSNPILIMSQTLDPITPLLSAKGAATLFPGSQVVEAQGIGHTTLGYPSVCAMRQVKAYFATGKVPDNYTYCAANLKPFQSMAEVVETTNSLPVLEDRYLLAAGLKIASDFPPGNKERVFDYVREGLDLPGRGEGDWWVVSGGVGKGEEMEELVGIQYR